MTGPGLHDKYMIFRRSDETPVHHPCFVLRIDGTDEAAMKALREYANHTTCRKLAADLHHHVDHIARYGGGEGTK